MVSRGGTTANAKRKGKEAGLSQLGQQVAFADAAENHCLIELVFQRLPRCREFPFVVEGSVGNKLAVDEERRLVFHEIVPWYSADHHEAAPEH
ncbi:MAG: hypothetical protein A3I07_03505 [Candidatus Doudnabacteria bacterium RIFCSPLOWO2_02_FULL_42_9]|uniref:Uncharacterized protein n=1 Tax=Candidatus Doudnabacteria bacterium RIFCSPHIGHO2_01_FULL_41_86 TaxID=1817821 RepID=A0A1F5N8A9_9BACT|nr:MAG: hypothetical protein A2717_04675 [Candidatus Doudnabacteria bacterium RIFCSPHIGHO2_01_FULL_41_86]OGE75904.1 MAG: hypothetical protein A3K07_04265 [Candidatus Doudnabacteria bacterium RIFCSPHIGHO2_01_43_10]OGE86279.1 MAG: hypothetical protein A3E28_04030 [Candidatus Doudnabacteria bacterium RIFCSPHIGHO2_12_FULL_42_22]OGE87127.1 MAG: hypothetical protein A3C49_03695 [Candidatus Doudnabacteria bacterium RIFCSPHIGHO2_02_FULL_42_25]OGE92267.1 MAG: hypothetical protein A2895_04380 [Candidatus